MTEHQQDVSTPEAAVIVAGGASRRMGGLAAAGKAGLVVGGVPLLRRVCEAVGRVVPRIVVVAAPGQPLPSMAAAASIEVVCDSTPGSGPLAAIADGLRLLGTEAGSSSSPMPPIRCLLASCDLPLLQPRLARHLLDLLAGTACTSGIDWVVPRVAGQPQLLLSAMSTSALVTIDRCLASGRRDVRRLLDLLQVRWVEEPELRVCDPDLASFRDIDTPQDLESIAGMIAAEMRSGR